MWLSSLVETVTRLQLEPHQLYNALSLSLKWKVVSMSAANDVVYSRRLTGRNIRLLTLFPGGTTSHIHCQFDEASLDDDLDFEALSYVWGESVFDERVTCNGQRICISQSLKKALRRLRLINRPRIIWADAICINQRDITERNEQVKFMREIYSRARRVLVHLVDRTFSEIGFQDLLFAMKHAHTCHDMETRYGIMSPGDRYETLRTFFQHAWFSRIWCVQEIALAKEAKLLFGPAFEISWKEIVTSARLLNLAKELDTSFYIHDVIQASTAAYRMSHARQYSAADLLFVLCSFRHCGSSDPKDKIYALLGLGDWECGRSPVQVDYEKFSWDVYIETAIAILEAREDLALLSAVGELDEHLPTWVPAWNKAGPNFDVRSLILWSACGDKKVASWKLTKSGSLELRGRLFDFVTSVSGMFGEEDTWQQFGQKWYSTAEISHALNGIVSSPRWCSARSSEKLQLFSSLAYALVQGRKAGLLPVEEDDESRLHSQLWNFVKRMPYDTVVNNLAYPRLKNLPLGNNDLEADPDMQDYNQFASRIMMRLAGRRLFLTEDGYFGNGPGTMQENDVVVVLHGGSVPYILRPIGEDFHFVGACYLHDIMKGQIWTLRGDEQDRIFKLL